MISRNFQQRLQHQSGCGKNQIQKDAASSAIYDHAGNGVIIVTTKRVRRVKPTSA